MVGRRIGNWILERELGHGGMGLVFEARHVSLPSRAAVKMLSPGLESEESFRQRFRREAELQATLRHPNVARVLDYVEENGQCFLAVEYLTRGSLADHLSRGENVPRPQAVAWARQALAGLAQAHAKGIVHRDVKPANLLLGDNDEIVVADFGIARAEGNAALTRTGVTVGTPHYMSPEQIVTPECVDQRSDIYSFGIVLYELLSGRKPFDAASQFAILQAQVHEPPPPLRSIDPSIPPALEAVVMRALAKKPEERYADCQSMIRDLDAPPRAPADGGTIHASSFLDRAPAARQTGHSPGAVRDRRRRVYRHRLAIGIVAALAVAAPIAYRVANEEAKPVDRPAPPPFEHTRTKPDEPQNAITTTTTTKPDESQNAITTTTERPPGPPHRRPSSNSTTTALPVQAVQIAPAPPRPVPQLPERPRIAVIGTGDDRLLAGALEQEMEHRLDSYDVADEQGDPEVGELIRTKGASVNFKELGATLLKSGFQVLVMLRVEKGESRTTSIHGIDGSVKAARMHLNAYMLPTLRSLGRGWTEPAEYTELSITATARNAFIGPTADLRSAIDSEWGRLRSAGGAP
jgi:serine/threonine protein kinase